MWIVILNTITYYLPNVLLPLKKIYIYFLIQSFGILFRSVILSESTNCTIKISNLNISALLRDHQKLADSKPIN